MNIARDVVSAIEAHAREAAPQECCGLLIGSLDTITDSVRASNRAAEPERRYEIDPVDHFAAIRRARDARLEVVGAYHSHPRSEPVPSQTDSAEAFENFVFVIVGRSREQSLSIRAWRLSSGNFTEVALVSVP